MAENIRVVCSLRKDLSQGLFSCIPLSKRTQRGRLRPAHIARPRGATPRPRSGAEAGRTPCPRGGSQEESPHVRGQGQKPGGPHARGAASRSGILPALSDSSYAHPNPEPPLPPQVTSKFTSLPLFVVLSCKRASLDDARAQPSKF